MFNFDKIRVKKIQDDTKCFFHGASSGGLMHPKKNILNLN